MGIKVLAILVGLAALAYVGMVDPLAAFTQRGAAERAIRCIGFNTDIQQELAHDLRLHPGEPLYKDQTVKLDGATSVSVTALGCSAAESVHGASFPADTVPVGTIEYWNKERTQKVDFLIAQMEGTPGNYRFLIASSVPAPDVN